jgi:hypothetical protein
MYELQPDAMARRKHELQIERNCLSNKTFLHMEQISEAYCDELEEVRSRLCEAEGEVNQLMKIMQCLMHVLSPEQRARIQEMHPSWVQAAMNPETAPLQLLATPQKPATSEHTVDQQEAGGSVQRGA